MNEKLYLGSRANGGRGVVRPNSEPARPRGTEATGRIVKLLVGQGHGFIRLADGRDVFFHRGDLTDDTPFNGFQVGDTVRCEVLEDRFSGARALHVKQK